MRSNPGKSIELKGAKSNNLQNGDIKINLGTFIAVSRVSGNGKSSLIIHALYKAALKHVEQTLKIHPGEYDSIHGLENIDKKIDINQAPIGRTPRSNPSTYTGAFTPIRDWYTALPQNYVVIKLADFPLMGW